MLEADASKYFFINQGMLTIDRVDDVQEMKDTKKAFDILMFTQEQQMDLFIYLKIKHTLNTNFSCEKKLFKCKIMSCFEGY